LSGYYPQLENIIPYIYIYCSPHGDFLDAYGDQTKVH